MRGLEGRITLAGFFLNPPYPPKGIPHFLNSLGSGKKVFNKEPNCFQLFCLKIFPGFGGIIIRRLDNSPRVFEENLWFIGWRVLGELDIAPNGEIPQLLTTYRTV